MKIFESVARVTVLLGVAVVSGMLASNRMPPNLTLKSSSESLEPSRSKYEAHPMIHSLQWNPKGDWLLFAKEVSIYSGFNEVNIYKMRRDGSGMKRLYPNAPITELLDVGRPRFDVNPQWSGDGKRIAFYVANSPEGVKKGHRGAIWVIDANGSHLRPLKIRDQDRRIKNRWRLEGLYAWSPDNRLIAARLHLSDKGTRVALVNVLSGNIKRVLEASDCYGFHPSGERLLALREGKLVEISLRSGQARELNWLKGLPAFSKAYPRYSADGSALIFTAYGLTGASGIESRSPLWIATLDGSSLQNVPARIDQCHNPSLSPNGDWVAFVGGAGLSELIVSRADGSVMRALDTNDDNLVTGAGLVSPV